MGKNQKRLLLFAIQYPGWHTWSKDRTTVDAVRAVSSAGFIETNEFRQFRIASPTCTHDTLDANQ